MSLSCRHRLASLGRWPDRTAFNSAPARLSRRMARMGRCSLRYGASCEYSARVGGSNGEDPARRESRRPESWQNDWELSSFAAGNRWYPPSTSTMSLREGAAKSAMNLPTLYCLRNATPSLPADSGERRIAGVEEVHVTRKHTSRVSAVATGFSRAETRRANAMVNSGTRRVRRVSDWSRAVRPERAERRRGSR